MDYIKLTKPKRRKVKLFEHKGLDKRFISNDMPVEIPKCCDNLKSVNDLLKDTVHIERFTDKGNRFVTSIGIPEFAHVFPLGNGKETGLAVASYDQGLSLCKGTETNFGIAHSEKNKRYWCIGDVRFKGDTYTLCSHASNANCYYQFKNLQFDKILFCGFMFELLCGYHERVFGVDIYMSNRLRFTATDNIEIWLEENGGGYIDIDASLGKIKRLMRYNEKLLIIADYGMFTLTGFYDPSEFVVKKVDIDSGKIVPTSVCDCGDKLMFLSSNGLNIYDGYYIKTIFPELMDFVYQMNKAHCEFLDNKFYISGCMGEKMIKNNCLIIVDLENFSYSVTRGLEGDAIILLKFFTERNIVCFSTYLTYEDELARYYTIKEGGVKSSLKIWQSGILTLGSVSQKKVLRSIEFFDGSNISVEILADGVAHNYNFDLHKKQKINLEGFKFEFAIKTYDGIVKLSSPVVEIDYI